MIPLLTVDFDALAQVHATSYRSCSSLLALSSSFSPLSHHLTATTTGALVGVAANGTDNDLPVAASPHPTTPNPPSKKLASAFKRTIALHKINSTARARTKYGKAIKKKVNRKHLLLHKKSSRPSNVASIESRPGFPSGTTANEEHSKITPQSHSSYPPPSNEAPGSSESQSQSSSLPGSAVNEYSSNTEYCDNPSAETSQSLPFSTPSNDSAEYAPSSLYLSTEDYGRAWTRRALSEDLELEGEADKGMNVLPTDYINRFEYDHRSV